MTFRPTTERSPPGIGNGQKKHHTKQPDTMPSELRSLAVQALKAGHRVKLSSLVIVIPDDVSDGPETGC